MRVTHRMVTDSLINDLRANLERLETVQRQLSTGKRLSRPADDPPAVARALTYRAEVSAGEQYVRNMDSSLAWLGATENSLASATEILQRARELAIQGSNDTLGAPQQQAIAAEVDQILEQMVMLGNSTFRGQHLFAGLRIDAAPFTVAAGPPTTVTYSGDSGQMQREVDVGSTIAINVPGGAAFTSSFNALIALRDDLRAGNTAAVRSADLPSIDAALDDLLGVRAEVGSKVNRIEIASARQMLVGVHLQDLLSKAEDTDFAEATTRFATAETLYKAALAAGAKAIQPSLLDFLR